MKDKKIAFIGGGNMARSLISGLLKADIPPHHIHATDLDAGKINELANEFGIIGSTDNAAAAKSSDIIVLAVKPQFMADMLTELTKTISDYSNKLVISIAAGVTIQRISSLIIVRCMPNTPSLIGLGVTGLYAPISVSVEDRTAAEGLLQAAGKTVWVNTEVDINAVTATSGSGPAYFFLFMQAMIEEAEKMGFSNEAARLLVQETALGAAQMVINNPQTDLATLRAQVTSKGGTTAAAIAAFEDGGLQALVSQAMQAAQKRAEEMETLF